MRIINVDSQKPYNVYIGNNLIPLLDKTLNTELVIGSKCVIVTDENVAPLYLGAVRSVISRVCPVVEKYIIVPGEKSKNLQTVSDMLEFFCTVGLSKTDFVVALGGGVVGDITGFAASIYLRGIEYVQIPTTLLAQVDSSIGGKTGIDLVGGKNLAGSFHQASLVICDYSFLKSLSDEILSDGIAEVIKYAAVCDPELFGLLSDNGFRGNEETVIYTCTSIKKTFVEKDEFDDGLRKLLNFGHTIGHAIEKLSDYSVMHGSAVSIGMAMISRASETAGFCETAVFDKLTKLLEKFNLPTRTDYSAESICEAALSEKKIRDNEINVIIPQEIGLCMAHEMSLTEFRNFIIGSKEGEFEWMLR